MLLRRRWSFTLLEELSMHCSWSFDTIAYIWKRICRNHFRLSWAISIPVSCYIAYSSIPIIDLFILFFFFCFFNFFINFFKFYRNGLHLHQPRRADFFCCVFWHGRYYLRVPLLWAFCGERFGVGYDSGSLSRKRNYENYESQEFAERVCTEIRLVRSK